MGVMSEVLCSDLQWPMLFNLTYELSMPLTASALCASLRVVLSFNLTIWELDKSQRTQAGSSSILLHFGIAVPVAVAPVHLKTHERSLFV